MGCQLVTDASNTGLMRPHKLPTDELGGGGGGRGDNRLGVGEGGGGNRRGVGEGGRVE